ncbi:hypothetical protein [Aestuariispira insulae]|uniref:EF hand domain-containing protein n=1 Tax=Aestuariispira insulae TaxID=1461337 RepID=A0A3D9HRY5_9PROT|nr:hypothetical protein [Aestuariispira insulae]RED52091.1 EF hand domain-containing protein [Aestuariispira insulae]
MTMKTFFAVSAAAMIASSAALAGGLDFETTDQNADGFVSFKEIQAVAKDITAESFLEADGDKDGVLSTEEFSALVK